MPWDIAVSGSGGTGTGEGMVIHGPEYHTGQIPTVINPNLLYNSTGMMNMIGWITHPKVINFRDEFIIDDFSYFLATGNSAEADAMFSASVPLTPGKQYTFSGEFSGPAVIKVTMLYQDVNHVNLLTEFVDTLVLCEEVFTDLSVRKNVTFTPPAGTHSGSLKIEFLATDEAQTAIYKRLKIEEGAVATAWIPCLTDPYQNNIVIQGLTAADMV